MSVTGLLGPNLFDVDTVPLQESDHYICTSDAQIICLPGWSEPERLCRTPVCRFHDLQGEEDTDVVSKARRGNYLLKDLDV